MICISNSTRIQTRAKGTKCQAQLCGTGWQLVRWRALWHLPTTAGDTCDVSSGSRSCGEGNCMVTGTRHWTRSQGVMEGGDKKAEAWCARAMWQACQVVSSETCVMWSGMRQSEITVDAYLTSWTCRHHSNLAPLVLQHLPPIVVDKVHAI